MSIYLEGLKIHTKLFSIQHGLEVLQTAVDAVQIVHQLHPEDTFTFTTSETSFIIHWLLVYSDPQEGGELRGREGRGLIWGIFVLIVTVML